MLRQHIQGAINVEDEVEAPEQGLVGIYRGEPAAGKSIERKRRNTGGVELSRPHLDVGGHAAGAMLQYDDRQSTGPHCDPKLSGGCRRPAIGITVQELRIRQRHGVNRMELSARRHVMCDGLGARE
jgi:hypothetical protein